jgi:Cu+-exporting ATPase
MFVRSTFDIMDYGSGFFDSLTGLIFYAPWQNVPNKTYSFLSFERDFKSYFQLQLLKLILMERS